MYFTYLWLIKYIKKKISIFTEIIRFYNSECQVVILSFLWTIKELIIRYAKKKESIDKLYWFFIKIAFPSAVFPSPPDYYLA
jgi:hypothetical protein